MIFAQSIRFSVLPQVEGLETGARKRGLRDGASAPRRTGGAAAVGERLRTDRSCAGMAGDAA
jgi:hypothetical protein